jgi:hypothetical protein
MRPGQAPARAKRLGFAAIAGASRPIAPRRARESRDAVVVDAAPGRLRVVVDGPLHPAGGGLIGQPGGAGPCRCRPIPRRT